MKKVALIIGICVVLVVVVSLGVAGMDYFNQSADDFLDTASPFKSTENLTVIATVGDEKIYQETIDFLMEGYKFSQKNFTQNKTSSEIAIQSETLPTEKEIIREQVKKLVILQDAEKLGLKADYEESYQCAKDNYDLAKKVNDENYKLIESYIKKLNLTETEYLDLIAQSYQNSFTRANHYKKFIEDKTGTDEELKSQYDNYVNELIENADIIYIDDK